MGKWHASTQKQAFRDRNYLTSTLNGQPTFGGQGAFASNKYTWDQTHLSNAVSLKSDTKGVFDFDLSASSYNYLQDILLNPFTVTPTGVGYSLNGKITRNDGTNWQNADAKGIWRPFGFDGPQEISFGAHGDRYRLENPVYAVVSLVRDVLDRHRSNCLRRSRRNPNRRTVAAGRLEDRSQSEADAGRAAGELARTGWFQHQLQSDANTGVPAAPIPVFVPVPKNQPGLEFDKLLAKSLALVSI